MRLLKLALLSFSSLYAQSMTAVVGPWPPYHEKEVLDADQMTQKVKSALEKKGHELSVNFMPWTRASHETASTNSDFSISWSKDALREEKFLFSKPIGKTVTKLFSLKDHQLEISKIEDLNGLRIGHVRGYQLPEILQKAQELGLCTLDFAKTDKQNMMKLIGGRVDLILVDTQVAQYHMKNDFTGYQNFIHPVGTLSWTENLHIIVSKEHKNAQELMSLVDEALEGSK